MLYFSCISFFFSRYSFVRMPLTSSTSRSQYTVPF